MEKININEIVNKIDSDFTKTKELFQKALKQEEKRGKVNLYELTPLQTYFLLNKEVDIEHIAPNTICQIIVKSVDYIKNFFYSKFEYTDEKIVALFRKIIEEMIFVTTQICNISPSESNILVENKKLYLTNIITLYLVYLRCLCDQMYYGLRKIFEDIRYFPTGEIELIYMGINQIFITLKPFEDKLFRKKDFKEDKKIKINSIKDYNQKILDYKKEFEKIKAKYREKIKEQQKDRKEITNLYLIDEDVSYYLLKFGEDTDFLESDTMPEIMEYLKESLLEISQKFQIKYKIEISLLIEIFQEMEYAFSHIPQYSLCEDDYIDEDVYMRNKDIVYFLYLYRMTKLITQIMSTFRVYNPNFYKEPAIEYISDISCLLCYHIESVFIVSTALKYMFLGYSN